MKDKGRQKQHQYRLLFAFILLCTSISLCIFLSSALAGQSLNINTADENALVNLPYIGEARARAIVDYRRRHGFFTKPEDLLNIKTIGPKSLEAVRPYLSFSGHSNSNRSLPHESNPDQGRCTLLADDQYFPVLINFIKSAVERIELAMFLFKTTDSPHNRPTLLLKELVNAQKRGVEVQVILEKSGYSDSINKENQRTASIFKKHDIKVRFDSTGKTTHTKMVIIDNRFCFVGSHNFSQSALTYNHEMSLLVDNDKMAKQLSAYMAAIK